MSLLYIYREEKYNLFGCGFTFKYMVDHYCSRFLYMACNLKTFCQPRTLKSARSHSVIVLCRSCEVW